MKNENYFSEDFKELLSKMLSPNPSDRLTIDQIKNSNFYKGSVATIEDVWTEMEKRWKRLSARGESPFTQLPFVDPNVYEDVTLKFRDLFEEKKFELEALKCKQYFKGFKTTNQFFSTYNP